MQGSVKCFIPPLGQMECKDYSTPSGAFLSTFQEGTLPNLQREKDWSRSELMLLRSRKVSVARGLRCDQERAWRMIFRDWRLSRSLNNGKEGML
jgi:hypothetical protein